MTEASRLYEELRSEMETVLMGNEEVIELLTIALLCRGHVLLEGPPGVAKTTIANLLARGSGLEYRRVQMTPDLLPADITGSHVFQQTSGGFELRKGAIFANIVVADEINRAPPKTQSALLEAMQELQVTIEGETLQLPEPFMLIATQNPIEVKGVFDLPEAQRDRFLFKIPVELLQADQERELLDRFDADPDIDATGIDSVVTAGDIQKARADVAGVYVADEVKDYNVDIANATRDHEDVAYGASTRASIMLQRAAKARAAVRDRRYVIPDDMKSLARPLLVHRLVPTTEAELEDVRLADLVETIVDSVTPPGIEYEPEDPAA